VRREGSLPSHSLVTPLVGSLTQEKDVRETLQGTSAACLVFGPRPPYSDIFCAGATQVVVAEMARLSVPRVLCQTGAMIGDYRPNRTWAFELMGKLNRRSQPAVLQDRVAQEEIVRSSGLAWTLVKPPRLTAGTRKAHIRVGPEVRVGLLSSVPRSNLASLFVEEFLRPRFERQTVFVRGQIGGLAWLRAR